MPAVAGFAEQLDGLQAELEEVRAERDQLRAELAAHRCSGQLAGDRR
jgi:hypothetical protein